MQPNIRRDRALIGLLIVGAAINIGAVRIAAGRNYAIPPETPLPQEFDGWKGTVIPTTESTQVILPHARINTIAYEKPGMPVTEVSITASRDPNDMHTPERCFTGAGSAITEREIIPLVVPGPNPTQIPMNKMVASESGQSAVVLYGYDNVPQLGGTTWATRIMMKIKPMEQPAYCVRFTSPVVGDVKSTQDRLMAFAANYLANRHTWEIQTSPK